MRLVHPAVPDASFPVPAAPPVGSPLFVAGGNLSADMAQMLNSGWSPAALLPSHAYSAGDTDYRLGFGAPASATSTPTPGHASSDGIPPAAVNDLRPSTPTAAPAPQAAAPAPEAAPAAKAVARMSGEDPVASPQASAVAPSVSAPRAAPPDAASIEASLIDEMLQSLAQGMIAARDNLALPTG